MQQTSAEVDRLEQRNAQAVSNLKQLEATLDTVPRSDLQAAYTAALDIQKRMLMMRGQLENYRAINTTLADVADLRKIAETLQQVSDWPARLMRP